MIKVKTVVILLFAFPLIADDVWTPPENPDPQEILDQASDDARNGLHATALAKHLWYHENSLKYSPAQKGVRLSFALMYWKKLGEDYPPALEALEIVRVETGLRIYETDIPQKDFHDYAEINRVLGKDDETVKAFQKLQLRSPEAADLVFVFAKKALLKGKHFELLLHHMNPEKELERQMRWFRISEEMTNERKDDGHHDHRVLLLHFKERKFTNDSATFVAILAMAGETERATKIAEQAKEFRDVPELHKAIDEALEGKVPKPFP